jgi:hypothetical protein
MIIGIAVGAKMIWWAYTGFSGSIVGSFALLAALLGVPVEALARSAVETLAALLIVGVMIDAFVAAVFRRRARPTSADVLRAPKVKRRLSQAVAAADVKQPTAPRITSVNAPSRALAGLPPPRA